MKAYLKFVAIGSVFAAAEEFLTVVVLRHDVGAFVVTLLLVFPVFLTLAWATSWLLRRVLPSHAIHLLVHYVLYGSVGLAFEWFVIGLSPWSNPEANPLLMFLFQLGMFSFWTTVAFAPLLFVYADPMSRKTRRWLLRFYVPWMVLTYVLAAVVAPELRFGAVIGMIVGGYSFLNVFYVSYLFRAFRARMGKDVGITPLES